MVAMDELTRRMTDLGAPDAAGWAASELRENVPNQARYLFLRSIWPRDIEPFGGEEVIRRFSAGARLLDAGASPSDLSALLRGVAYEVAFSAVDRIDDRHDPDAPPDSPGWVLMETNSEGQLTGRELGGLHEDLLMLDPSGREGGALRD
jgi:hypothetical protein